jgi:DNA-binding IscR family transcriptional regulator
MWLDEVGAYLKEMEVRPMPLLPPKAVLAIAAVTDIALNARMTRIRGKALARHLGLQERYLETVLQALARHDIVKATRGPRGGYQLAARHSDQRTANRLILPALY